MSKKQNKFFEIKGKLKKTAQKLYDLPSDAQVDFNLVNMSNFFPLINDIITTFQPRVICEIGSDQGGTTESLYKYCAENKVRLHVVDPALDIKMKPDDVITYFPEMSIPYLQAAESADIYFIDGDHNYYTVLSELRLIRDKNIEEMPRLLFLHDVGWPCGYRDMYYDESTIAKEYRKSTTSGLSVSVFDSSFSGKNLGLPIEEVSIAVKDGGEANGVLSAIEDFLEESAGWSYFSIPSIYGLGVLWYGSGATEPMNRKLESLAENFHRNRPFLSTLEFNRILLLEKLEESGKFWEKQKEHIEGQNKEIEGLLKNRKVLERKIASQGEAWGKQKEHIEGQNKQIEGLLENRKVLERKIASQGEAWGKQKEHIEGQNKQIKGLLENRKVLERKITNQGETWERQQNYISDLVNRNIALDLKLMEVGTLLGWLRYKIRSF